MTEECFRLDKKRKHGNMGDLNMDHMKADKKTEKRHADKSPLDVVSESTGQRGE